MAELERERSATDSFTKPKAAALISRAQTEKQRSEPVNNTHNQPRQQFVLTDVVALKYLQEDPSARVVGEPQRLEGYECYLVEQWACSRAHPTFMITTYTGDRSHSVVASILSVPSDEQSWSPRLKVFFKALTQYHARRRETPWGTLMVTNISAFPSSLTIIPIPAGDPKNHREDFFVNENLKRLNCSGRVGINLTKPAAATAAKFYQLYRASDNIDLYKAVIELVKLCQVALTLFDQLGAEYADGLLCDVTEKAATDWWTEIGNDLYNVEPQDGTLGPTTVSALLGTLIGARNRLSAYGAQTSKDVFDLQATKRAIAYFQKSQRLPKTRRLDRTTLFRLHSATAKAAASEGWKVPRIMKSTVAELGGKGGEMVMDLVGGRDKAGIAEVETVDIEQFVQLIRGERAKWLWYGKVHKHHGHEIFDKLPVGPGSLAMEFKSHDDGKFAWQGVRRSSSMHDPLTPGPAPQSSADLGRTSNDMSNDNLVSLRPRRQQPIREDSKRHIGKIRNAVSLRTHRHGALAEEDGHVQDETAQREGTLATTGLSVQGMKPVAEQTKQQRTPAALIDSEDDELKPSEDQQRAPLDAPFEYDTSHVVGTPTVASSIAGSNYHGIDLDELFSPNEGIDEIGRYLRRSRSAEAFQHYAERSRVPDSWPRHLSFSIAEESLLRWDTSGWDVERDAGTAKTATGERYKKQRLVADDGKRLRVILSSVDVVARRVNSSIEHIRSTEEILESDLQELDGMYYPRLEAYQRLRLESQEALAGGKTHLTEVLKDVEILGAKLDYEISALRSKVEDVEEGVDEFGRQVSTVKSMVDELEGKYRERASQGAAGWVDWAWKTVSEFGTLLSKPAAATGETQQDR